jgi:hypothetical protein
VDSVFVLLGFVLPPINIIIFKYLLGGLVVKQSYTTKNNKHNLRTLIEKDCVCSMLIVLLLFGGSMQTMDYPLFAIRFISVFHSQSVVKMTY